MSNVKELLNKLIKENAITTFPYVACNAFKVPNTLSNKIVNTLVSLRLRRNTLIYNSYFGSFPNYVVPQSWSEKMQWRKAFDRNPLFCIFCDKTKVRDYVQAHTPELLFPRFLWVGKDAHSLPFHKFKVPYVIKPNHGSGLIIKINNQQN